MNEIYQKNEALLDALKKAKGDNAIALLQLLEQRRDTLSCEQRTALNGYIKRYGMKASWLGQSSFKAQ